MKWTDEQKQLLIKNRYLSLDEQLKLFSNLTKNGLTCQRKKLGINNKWTPEEDNILINNKDKSYDELANIIHHSRVAIRGRVGVLRSKGLVINTSDNLLRWTDKEIRIFNEKVQNVTLIELCKLLPNRTVGAIKCRCVQTQKFPIPNLVIRCSGKKLSSFSWI